MVLKLKNSAGVFDLTKPTKGFADLFKYIEKETAKARKKESATRVMQRAWRRAKKAAEQHGGKASDYIRETMKSSWKTEKKMFPVKSKKPVKAVSTEPISEYSVKLNVLYDVLRDAQTYGDTNEGTGAIMESMNAGNLLEFLYDLENEHDAKWIVENIEKSGISIYDLAAKMERIVLGHYDEVYAKWAHGGPEAFKQAIRDIEVALSGETGTLVDKFFK